MDTLSDNRNGTSEFARRTQKNLDFIVLAAQQGQDVHPVTQAVSSLLGIVIFPWQHSAFDIVKRERLPILSANHGWPEWKMSGTRRVIDVGELMHVLRNSVAHGKIQFASDSRNPSDVEITFSQDGWQGAIRGDQLIDFCRCFMAAMKSQVD
jgi:hypothetical protein